MTTLEALFSIALSESKAFVDASSLSNLQLMHTSSKTACNDAYLCCIFPYGARHRIGILFPLHRSCAAASFGIHAQKHASNPEVRNDRRFAVGDYKRIPNEVADRETTIPENAPREIARLLDSYDPKASHTLEQITDFHVQLERVHPSKTATDAPEGSSC